MESSQATMIESYSREFRAQLRRINAYVTHAPSIGTAHEGILRRFLQKYIPKRYAVSEGFVLNRDEKPSPQCDIIIWNHMEYAPVYLDGDFVIVQPDSVRVVIEVKTTLNKESLENGYNNLHRTRMCSSHIYTALFSFESIQPTELIQHLIHTINMPLGDSVNSIYSMAGWDLQQIKDIPLDEANAFFEETKQEILGSDETLYPLILSLHPPEKASTYGLTSFLSHIFVNLDLAGYDTPYTMLPGSLIHGHIFPGRGVSFYYAEIEKDSDSIKDSFLSGAQLKEYFQHLDKHSHNVNQLNQQ